MQFPVTYDRDADAAYIYFTSTKPSAPVSQVVAVAETIILDFDANRRLVGIEVLSASNILAEDILRSAGPPGAP